VAVPALDFVPTLLGLQQAQLAQLTRLVQLTAANATAAARPRDPLHSSQSAADDLIAALEGAQRSAGAVGYHT
jgi:hypothetical protein